MGYSAIREHVRLVEFPRLSALRSPSFGLARRRLVVGERQIVESRRDSRKEIFKWLVAARFSHRRARAQISIFKIGFKLASFSERRPLACMSRRIRNVARSNQSPRSARELSAPASICVGHDFRALLRPQSASGSPRSTRDGGMRLASLRVRIRVRVRVREVSQSEIGGERAKQTTDDFVFELIISRAVPDRISRVAGSSEAPLKEASLARQQQQRLEEDQTISGMKQAAARSAQ